jgi:hypothetical protein
LEWRIRAHYFCVKTGGGLLPAGLVEIPGDKIVRQSYNRVESGCFERDYGSEFNPIASGGAPGK